MRSASKRRGRARVIGLPGRSARSDYRAHLATYRTVPLKWLLLVATILVGIVAAAAFSLNIAPGLPAAVAAAALLVTHVIVRFPSGTATVAVLVGFFPFTAPIAAMYAYAASGRNADLAGSTLTLIAAALVTALLAHRTSRGRPWLTTLLAVLAISLAAPFLLYAAPSLGFYAAYLASGLVLFLRGGGIAWFAAQWESLRDTISRLRDRQVPAEITDRKRAVEGEQRTAAHLADLDDRHTVLHDLAMPDGRGNIDHLVLGPAGVFVIESQKYKGVIREHRTRGLEHNGRPLAGTFHSVLGERAAVAKALRIPEDAVQALVVVHDAVLPSDRTRVALFTGTGERLGDVLVLAPAALHDEIVTGIEVLSKRQMTRLLRRARHRLAPASAGGPLAAKTVTAQPYPATGTASVLDADGKPKAFPADATPTPMFSSTTVDVEVTVGQRVSLLTDQGSFENLRVCGEPTIADNGVVTVAVCEDQAWLHGQETGIAPDSFAFPLASVRPA